MNIFYTNADPRQAAREHCKKHRNKMIVEYAQMLSTAHRMVDGEETTIAVLDNNQPVPKTHTEKVFARYRLRKWQIHRTDDFDHELTISGRKVLNAARIYAKTHHNHPCSLWIRESVKHYNWVFHCALELTNMYYDDTKKEHKTRKVLQSYLRNPPIRLHSMGTGTWVDPPLAMPDEMKFIGKIKGTTYGYQEYLNGKFKEWGMRENPIPVEFDQCEPEWLDR